MQRPTASQEPEGSAEGISPPPIPRPSKKAVKLLGKMSDGPASDWTIADLESVATGLGIRFSPPSNGSHYKVSSKYLPGILTIPARKPIKTPYVKMFVSFCRAHISQQEEDPHG